MSLMLPTNAFKGISLWAALLMNATKCFTQWQGPLGTGQVCKHSKAGFERIDVPTICLSGRLRRKELQICGLVQYLCL
eukprot:scaffold211706_cov25-Prasinocladus_malaysianus.AAC.2